MSRCVAFFFVASVMAFTSFCVAGDDSALGHPNGAIPPKMLSPEDYQNQPKQLNPGDHNEFSQTGGFDGNEGNCDGYDQCGQGDPHGKGNEVDHGNKGAHNGCDGYECGKGDRDGKGNQVDHGKQDYQDDHIHDAFKGKNDDDNDDDDDCDDDDDEHGYGYGYKYGHGGDDDGKKQEQKLSYEGPKCRPSDDDKHV